MEGVATTRGCAIVGWDDPLEPVNNVGREISKVLLKKVEGQACDTKHKWLVRECVEDVEKRGIASKPGKAPSPEREDFTSFMHSCDIPQFAPITDARFALDSTRKSVVDAIADQADKHGQDKYFLYCDTREDGLRNVTYLLTLFTFT